MKKGTGYFFQGTCPLPVGERGRVRGNVGVRFIEPAVGDISW